MMTAAPTGPHAHARLGGAAIKRLMRRHRVTIRGLSATHNIPMTRVRQVRSEGVQGFLALEWVFLITGKWPDLK